MRLRPVIFNEGKQFVNFIIDPDFYEKYGHKQYAYYELMAETDDAPLYANIYLPDDLDEADLAGTLAHEVTRLVTDWMQTQKATMTGKIVTEFWREYGESR